MIFAVAFVGTTDGADHADYIGHWLRILKGDRKAVFMAASAANKAADYLKSIAQIEHLEAA